MNSKNLAEFIGRIKNCKLTKVRDKKSSFLGNHYLRLQVSLEDESEIKEILVLEKYLENKGITLELERKNYLNKQYLFYCQRKPGAGRIYRLVDWKELNNNSFSERVRDLNNHGSNEKENDYEK